MRRKNTNPTMCQTNFDKIDVRACCIDTDNIESGQRGIQMLSSKLWSSLHRPGNFKCCARNDSTACIDKVINFKCFAHDFMELSAPVTEF